MPDRSELIEEYKRKSRLADDRLRRIEVASRKPEYKGIKNFAYRVALKDIRAYGGKKRFSTKPPESDRKLIAKIAAIDKFLDSPTSLIDKVVKTEGGKKIHIGVLPMYKERANTLNRNWGTNFDWKSLAKYFERGFDKTLESLLGSSGRALKVVAEIQRNKKEIKKAIKRGEEIDIDIDDEFIEGDLYEIINSDLGKEIAKTLI